jgi:hypothetical protein
LVEKRLGTGTGMQNNFIAYTGIYLILYLPEQFMDGNEMIEVHEVQFLSIDVYSTLSKNFKIFYLLKNSTPLAVAFPRSAQSANKKQEYEVTGLLIFFARNLQLPTTVAHASFKIFSILSAPILRNAKRKITQKNAIIRRKVLNNKVLPRRSPKHFKNMQYSLTGILPDI